MNAIFAALTGAVLVFGAAYAQGAAQGHGNPPGGPSGFPLPPPPVPQIGGPNRAEFPGQIPNHLSMKPNGEIESVGPNRHDFDRRFDNAPGNFATERRLNTPAWTPPEGYQYRRWAAGEHLPPPYYGSGRQITRYNLHGLTTPPPNTVWVRSGPDALLVNRTTGEIVRAQYGAFN